VNDAYRNDLRELVLLVQSVVQDDNNDREAARKLKADIKRHTEAGMWARIRVPHRRAR